MQVKMKRKKVEQVWSENGDAQPVDRRNLKTELGVVDDPSA